VFHEAIRKHGWSSFAWISVQSCNDRLLLDEAEKFWITSLDTIVPNGYNMNGGGYGVCKVSPEVCEKIRKSHLGKKLSSDHVRKMSDSLRGKTRSKEQRERMAAAMRGKPHLKARGPNGKHHSEETKKKLSEATKRSMTPERLQEIRKSNIGRTHSEETKKRMSEIHKSITPRGPSHPWYGKPGITLGRKRSPEEVQKQKDSRRKNRKLRGNENHIALDFENGRGL
jgi:group I intron endonuclease